MKKVVIIIVIIILVIILGIAIGIIDTKEKTQENINIKNDIEGTLDFNDILVDRENNNTNMEVVNEESNTIFNEVSSSETFEEEPKTEQEKAIDIVKTDWNGNNNSQNVKFTADGMDGSGRYIISVRDKDTTEALAFYTVNVQDKTFTKREMN